MNELAWSTYFSTQATKRDFLLKQLPQHARGAEIGVFAGDFSKRDYSKSK